MNQNKKLVTGNIVFVKQVKHTVAPTVVYHSDVKSLNLPVKIGKFIGNVIASVRFALISNKTSAVETY